MKCPSRQQLDRHLDGELSEGERLPLEEHLSGCPACRKVLKTMQAAAAALQAAGPARSPVCPDRETLLAYADGSLRNPRERRRIVDHIGACDRCALLAAEALETVRAAREIEAQGPPPVPPYLAARVRARLFPREPVRLGRVVVVLADLLQRMVEVFEFPDAVPLAGAVREPSAPYPGVAAGRSPGPSPATAGPREVFRTRVELRPGPSATAEMGIRLADRAGEPLSGVALRLEREGKLLARRATGSRGGAVFRDLRAGSYRLVIRHVRERHLAVRIRG